MTIKNKHDILQSSRTNKTQAPHGATGQATGREGKKMRQYQVIAFNRATGAMDYTSELLEWQKCNQTYFDAIKNYPNHEIVIVVNK